MNSQEKKAFKLEQTHNTSTYKLFEALDSETVKKVLNEFKVTNDKVFPNVQSIGNDLADNIINRADIYRSINDLLSNLNDTTDIRDQKQIIDDKINKIAQQADNEANLKDAFNIIIQSIDAAGNSELTSFIKDRTEIEIEKDKGRRKIQAALQDLNFKLDPKDRAEALSRIMNMADSYGLISEFIGTITDIANDIKVKDAQSLNNVLNSSHSAAIEKENKEREEFKAKMNKFSVYFDKDELKETEYKEIADYIDRPENEARVEKHTQQYIDKYHDLKAKEESVGLSDKERKEKKEAKQIARTGLKTHIVGEVEKQGKANDLSESKKCKVANKICKNPDHTNPKHFKDFQEFKDRTNKEIGYIVLETVKSEKDKTVNTPHTFDKKSQHLIKNEFNLIKNEFNLIPKDKNEQQSLKKEEVKDKESIQSSKSEISESTYNTQDQKTKAEIKPIEKEKRQFKLKKPAEPKIKESEKTSVIESLTPKDKVELSKVINNIEKSLKSDNAESRADSTEPARTKGSKKSR